MNPVAREPAEILGVDPEAPEAEVRAAYLRAVRLYPPERHPAEFEAVRDAYEALKDPRSRARARLTRDDPAAPLAPRYTDAGSTRPFLGPGPWLEALRP